MVQLIKQFDATKEQLDAYGKHHDKLMEFKKEISNCDFKTVNDTMRVLKSAITYESRGLLPKEAYIDLTNVSRNIIENFGNECSCMKR